MSDDVTRTTYVMVPTELISMVAEGSLSKDAAWLYVALLSHHNRNRRDNDVWPSRAVLAKEIGLKKADSVDRYLAELREAGLITSQQRRRVGNLKTSSKHTLQLVVPRGAADPDTPHSGYRPPVQRGTDAPATGDELEEVEPQELKEVQVASTTSGRCAPDGGGVSQTEDLKNEYVDPWATPATEGPRSYERPTFVDWRAIDRQTFEEHVGEVLISTGKRWKKGRYTAGAFYQAFRRKETNPQEWPGQYVNQIADNQGETGIDDWLISNGLERPEWR